MPVRADYIIKTCSDDFNRVVKMKNGCMNTPTHLFDCNSVSTIDRSKKGNTTKLDVSVIRARSKLFDLVYCNDFEYFVTCTIDGAKYDRSDLNGFRSKLAHWIRNYRQKHGCNIQYCFVPELHDDDINWHMHGFIKGLPQNHLRQFVLGDKMSSDMVKRVRAGEVLYNWLPYANKFGFFSCSVVRSKIRASRYILKYITKQSIDNAQSVGKHLYFPSRGLKRPVKSYVYGHSEVLNAMVTYENEWCSMGDIYMTLGELKHAIIDNDGNGCDFVSDLDFLPLPSDFPLPFDEVDCVGYPAVVPLSPCENVAVSSDPVLPFVYEQPSLFDE